ncbi:MAG: SLC13 family permease, partial [Pseudomonadales bacterium]|nr:SLC13 family permease [Pseudomonadales bacterium]
MLTQFPDVPNAHALASMLLTGLALILFSRERIRLEISSLGILITLAVGFSLFPYTEAGHTFNPNDFFKGFAHEALIAVCALMVVGQGLVRTGALEPVGRALANAWGRLPFLSFAATLIIAAALSAFINNTPVVVLLLPILISVCLKTNSSASRVLMPMGFATLVGGMATTIGTSTNLLVVSIASDLGLERFSMFDFAGPAIIAALVAIVYLWAIAPRLLPERKIVLSEFSPRLFEARIYLDEGSLAIGKTLGEIVDMAGGDMKVVRIRRGENYLYPLPDVKLKVGDRLRVKDTPANLKRYCDDLKATLYSHGEAVDDAHPLSSENQVLAEIAVVDGSLLDHANLDFTNFLERYQLAVLALHRAGRDIWNNSQENISEVILHSGDVLLVQGATEQIASIKRSSDFFVLDANMDVPVESKAPVAFFILLGVVASAAFGLIPIAISAAAGALFLLFTRCLRIGEAIRAISPQVYFVVVASLALGLALVETHATEYLTDVFLYFTAG